MIPAIALLNLNLEFISFILRGFSLSSRVFYLGNGHLTIPCGKNPKNLSETSSENKQNKLQIQVLKVRDVHVCIRLSKNKFPLFLLCALCGFFSSTKC